MIGYIIIKDGENTGETHDGPVWDSLPGLRGRRKPHYDTIDEAQTTMHMISAFSAGFEIAQIELPDPVPSETEAEDVYVETSEESLGNRSAMNISGEALKWGH